MNVKAIRPKLPPPDKIILELTLNEAKMLVNVVCEAAKRTLESSEHSFAETIQREINNELIK